MNLFAFMISSLLAALSATGVGGGGLYVLYLTSLCAVPQLTAQGMNLAFFIAGAVSSLVLHIRKRKIAWKLVLLVGLLGALGALCGAFLAVRLDAVLLSKAFGALLLICGIRTLFAKVKK